MFLGYNYRTMLRIAPIFCTLIVLATGSSANKNGGSDLAETKGNDKPSPTVSIVNNQACAPDKDGRYTETPPPWYESPEWWLFILGVPTLFYVARQAHLMKVHAEHFEKLADATKDNVIAAKDSLDLSRETAKKQLRAYFGTVAGKLYIYDDGTVEPRITFINCGQTPAYDLQVIECGRFETRPFRKALPPSQERLQSHPHVVGGGQPHYFSGSKIPYTQGKQQLLYDLSGHNYAFILNLWCTYRDIFKDSHPVNVQLIIGGGTALQRTIDANGEWFGLFTDSEGNTYD
jgi:hypothetical protein